MTRCFFLSSLCAPFASSRLCGSLLFLASLLLQVLPEKREDLLPAVGGLRLAVIWPVMVEKPVAGIRIHNLSCHLWVEDRKDGGSQDKENRLEFEAIGCDSMNMFRQQALYLATSSFDSFAIVCEQESHPRLPRSF